MYRFKLLILLLVMLQGFCNGGMVLDDTGNSFIYDTKKVDNLIADVQEMKKILVEMANMQTTQRTDTIHLVEQVAILKHENLESSKTLESIKISIQNSIQESILTSVQNLMKNSSQQSLQESILKSTTNCENLLNESVSLFEHKLNEFGEHQNEKISETLSDISELNIKFDHSLIECTQCETLNSTKNVSAVKFFFDEHRKYEDVKLSAITEKLDKIDRDLNGVETEKNKYLEPLQNFRSIFEKLSKIDENQEKITKTLYESNREINDFKFALNSYDMKQTVTALQESLAYSNCEQAVKYNGRSGAYFLRTHSLKSSIFKAYCLKDPKGKGSTWTVIMSRSGDSSYSSHFVDFNRTWTEYKEGFGDYYYWMGLENIFRLTNSTRYELWIRSRNWVYERIFDDVYYDDFKIADESENYKLLSIGNTKDERLMTCVNKEFNTIDHGNRTWVDSHGGGGFWGPCDVNYNAQFYNEGRLKIHLDFNNHLVNYIHFAIRPKTT